MNYAFSSNCIVIYDRLLYFLEIDSLLRDCFQNLVYLLSVGHVGV